ncbi:MAG: glycoside hydrolase family 76 protein, partial [Eubacteriales bacterium]
MKKQILLKAICASLACSMLFGCSAGVAETESVAESSETAETAETSAETDAESTETESAETEPVKLLTPAVETMEKVLSKEDYPTDLEEYARTLLDKIRSEITNERTGIAYEYLGKKQISFLWPFSVLLEATSALYECNTDDAELREYYVLLLDKFLPRYEGSKPGVKLVYSSTTNNGDRYYDDNEWIVIEYIRAYRLLGDEKYLESAKTLAEYVYSGWVNSSGGIRWIEGGDSCNTCSNGPASVLSCMLYEDTGDEYYLDWATKIYDWTWTKLCDTNGTYFDNIKINGGSVDRAKYSYNTGTMIVSGVMLYRITGDESYLNQARKSAAG